MSGTEGEGWSGVLVVPLDVGLGVGGPFFIDFYEGGADEAFERGFVGEDPDFGGAAFEFLLDAAFHGVGGAKPALVGFWQREGGEAFGDISFEPIGELWCGVGIGIDEGCESDLGSGEGIGVPDGPEFCADAFADGVVGGVVDGGRGGTGIVASMRRRTRRVVRRAIRHGHRRR